MINDYILIKTPFLLEIIMNIDNSYIKYKKFVIAVAFILLMIFFFPFIMKTFISDIFTYFIRFNGLWNIYIY